MRLELGESGGFQHGVFFDVFAKHSCQVKWMWVLADGPATLTLRACGGGWEASATDPNAWETRGEVHVPNDNEETKLVLNPPIQLEAGKQLGLYLHGPSPYAVAFTDSSKQPLMVENDYLTITRGRHTRSPTPFSNLWCGPVFYLPAGALEVVVPNALGMIEEEAGVREVNSEELIAGCPSESMADQIRVLREYSRERWNTEDCDDDEDSKIPHKASVAYDVLDVNRDGEVSFEELEAAMACNEAQEEHAELQPNHFSSPPVFHEECPGSRALTAETVHVAAETAVLQAEVHELRSTMQLLQTENKALVEVHATMKKLEFEKALLEAELQDEKAARAQIQTRVYEVARFGKSAALHQAELALGQAELDFSRKLEAVGKLKEVVALGIAVPMEDAHRQLDASETQVQVFKQAWAAEKDHDEQVHNWCADPLEHSAATV